MYIQAREDYSVLKRNDLLSQGKMRGGGIKCILLSNRSQSRRVIYHMIPPDNLEKAKLWRE